MRWPSSPRILSEQLAPLSEPLACLLTPGEGAALRPPGVVAALAAGALLDLEPVAAQPGDAAAWLAPHQVPAVARLRAILARYGGALLADAVGLGKSYVALAVALGTGEPFALVVPAVLVPQWRSLLARHDSRAPILTHESLSGRSIRLTAYPTIRLLVVDEAHRFRNPETNRYRALARLAAGGQGGQGGQGGRKVLLVTATPVHNRVAELFHLFRLFLRDHDLTALGVPSLRRAARGDVAAQTLAAVAARLVVARSRARARAGYPAGPVVLCFPERAAGELIRAGTAPERQLEDLVRGVAQLEVSAARAAAGLLRLTLLSQLASSLPAFRASLARYEAFLDLARAAAAEGRSLGSREFQRLFPRGEAADLQLTLLPLLLPPGTAAAGARDQAVVRRLRDLSSTASDPKADALARLLGERDGKTIVFVQSRATARYLLRRLPGRRVAAVMGEAGLFGREVAGRGKVLRAFAPRAQGAPSPAPALETDVLIATDLLSEGLNLQDAVRVIHYDLPWSPARLTQRVGRIDRAGSPHARIETITLLPAPPLAEAIALERRLLGKARAQARAGAGPHALDWCDRLQRLAATVGAAGGPAWAAVAERTNAAVLVVRIGGLVEALVVTEEDAAPDPVRATSLLERAARARPATLDPAVLTRAIERAAPLVRARLGAVEAARWRAEDRDRLGRRLIPWVLAAARRAAQRREHAELARLDALVSRLALGMTAGEELLLEDLLARGGPLAVRDVLAWHERLAPAAEGADVPDVQLVAAVVLRRPP